MSRNSVWKRRFAASIGGPQIHNHSGYRLLSSLCILRYPIFASSQMSVPSWFFRDQPYQKIPLCPYKSNLHQVVNAVTDVHNKVENNIVTLKHPGSPINSSSDENRNTTTDSVPISIADIQTQSPSDSPLGTKYLFPDFDHKDTLARLVKN